MKVVFNASAVVQAYSAAFRRLRALEGFSQRDLLRAEAGSILKAWAGKTPVTTVDKARQRARLSGLRAAGLTGGGGAFVDVTVTAGRRNSADYGKTYLRTQDGRWRKTHEANFVPVAGMPNSTRRESGDHYSEYQWLQLRSAISEAKLSVRERLRLAEGSIGLARQSVVQIADQLGIDLTRVAGQGVSASGIAKARAAIASSGRSYVNGFGAEAGDSVSYHVDLFTRLPYARKIGMDNALAEIMAGRAKYIQESYRRGAFDSVRGIARALPNLFRVTST